MKKLNQEQIRFIDRYLENSGIEFNDVKAELVDHVASEVEQRLTEDTTLDFYTAFKDFMAVHKRELLKSQKYFSKAMDKKVFFQLLKTLYKPGVWLISIVLFFGYRNLAIFNLHFNKGTWLEVIFVYSLIILVLFSFANYKKLLGMQRLAYQWYWLTGLPTLMFKKELIFLGTWDQLFMAFYILMNVSLLVTGLKIHRNYKKMFQLS